MVLDYGTDWSASFDPNQTYVDDLVGKGNGDFGELIEALSRQTRLVTDGNLDRGEAMLAVQAHTLDAIFNRLTRRALNSELMPHLETPRRTRTAGLCRL